MRPALDFNLADGHGYMLGRNYAAASRLNLQHYLWKESLQFNLHPSIPIPPEARIADVATGTAIWPIDVAREHPTVQLDCFDINISQAPPKPWLPPNIRLKTWDVYDNVPEQMTGKYDIVHVRLLSLVVQKKGPRLILQNLLRMLKPGGYIQWDELNYPGSHVKNCDYSLPTPALHALQRTMYSGGKNSWALHLPEYFAQEGMLDPTIYHFPVPPELTRARGEQHVLTLVEFASSLIAKTNHGEEAKTILGLIDEADGEVSGGAALWVPRVVCVGKKSGKK